MFLFEFEAKNLINPVSCHALETFFFCELYIFIGTDVKRGACEEYPQFEAAVLEIWG